MFKPCLTVTLSFCGKCNVLSLLITNHEISLNSFCRAKISVSETGCSLIGEMMSFLFWSSFSSDSRQKKPQFGFTLFILSSSSLLTFFGSLFLSDGRLGSFKGLRHCSFLLFHKFFLRNQFHKQTESQASSFSAGSKFAVLRYMFQIPVCT